MAPRQLEHACSYFSGKMRKLEKPGCEAGEFGLLEQKIYREGWLHISAGVA
jgi:hypothetical protein